MMRKSVILLIALVTAAVVLFTSCSGAGYRKISAEEAKEMMDAGGVTVVDVRRQDEYDEGHIEGALLLPNETIRQKAEGVIPDRDATYLLYCRTGRRSAEAAVTLMELGYSDVYDFGGIYDWPYEVVK